MNRRLWLTTLVLGLGAGLVLAQDIQLGTIQKLDLDSCFLDFTSRFPFPLNVGERV